MMDYHKLFLLMSDYFDHELERDIFDEMEEMIHDDLCCQSFFNTFCKTLDLCDQIEAEEIEVPQYVHIQLYRIIQIEIKKKSHKKSRR